jgi:hypothetical protein
MSEVYGWKTHILETMKSSGVYKLVPKGSIRDPAMYFRSLFYNSHREKIVPSYYLNATEDATRAFLCGYYAADGYRVGNNIRCCNKGQQGSAQLNYLFRKAGYSTSVYSRSDKPNIFKLTMNRQTSKSTYRYEPTSVKQTRILRKTEDHEFVYDIETEEGVFQAGIGDIIVKNTDSVFVKYDCRHPDGSKMTGREALKRSIDLGC